ncbi:beta-glucoside-specific PTS transporter subunit IIABC [Butyricicoccus pullicaecorum]|uniref:PTS system, beta-glucoside-specific IIABC component n=5 Tax=Butyricicoccus pullicaecorum TaxID=501571 RepID=R8W6C9_9FIRM|nr:beta-glucoside-specific PTS transporter subunit IIABC [Butyricicoccus pullicaecorum]EOQ40111.1 PTS system, beta-glucoside-specific IIABC component [Butyricicoccus pullicaecorum 1.2]OUP55611.1 PTS beta-glucoside transporter subunit EIIBCA [Butyricicoccus pullicaecorum]
MADNKQIAQQVLAAVGGAGNVSSVTHCMTRLRFVLKDQTIPNKDEISKIKGVVGVNISGGQYQVIIGNSVGNVYREMLALGGLSDTQNGPAVKQKVNPISAALDFIAGCMTPLFTAIIAGGLIKVLLVIFGPTLLGLMSDTSDTYILMNALGDAPFYFLPILVAITASKKLGCNSFLAAMVSSMLVYPNLITLLSSDTPTYLFGVIPVMHGSYASSIIPAMLATILLKYVEILVDKITPDWSKNFLKPLLIVIITAPITLCLLAPLGLMIGNVLQVVINTIYGFAPWLAMLLFAGFMPFIVMTGMHWAFVPACLMSLADPGFELMLLPAMLCSNTAQAGATFGAAFKTKDKDIKQMAFPAAISALLAGVTEPAMYGVTLRLKKPMIGACIAGAIGGLIAGFVNLKAFAFATPCLTAIVQFISPEGGSNFMFACIIFAVVLVLSFVLAFILTPANAEEASDTPAAPETTPASVPLCDKIVIEAPIPGEVIPLTEVKDQTFASGVLGEGYAIVPSEGKVYAPFDGTCDNLFDTLHAMGLVSDSGVELLIHVGLETVKLNGAPFTAHIKSGDTFKKGDLLLEFDIPAIQAAGCEIQTPVIVTNAEDVGDISIQGRNIVIGG